MSIYRPNFLHKFCSVERAMQIIVDSSLFLPPPEWMNDPYEFSALVEIPQDEDKQKELLQKYCSQNNMSYDVIIEKLPEKNINVLFAKLFFQIEEELGKLKK